MLAGTACTVRLALRTIFFRQEAEVRGFKALKATAVVATVGLTMVFAGSAAAAPATLYVAGSGGFDAGAAADTGNCQTESTPCAHLSYAVSQAAAGDTIEISGTLQDAAAVTLSQDQTLSANPDGSSATIDGNGDTDGLITISGQQTVTIRGLTLQNGQNARGGAISNETGILTVIDSTLADNAANTGGAIDNGDTAGGGSLTVIDSTLVDNAATGNGGAIANADGGSAGSLTVTDSSFTGNIAANDGGAIDNNDDGGSQGSVTITDSTLSGDTASADGDEIDTNDNLGFDSSVYVAGDVLNGTCDSNTFGGATWVDSGFNAARDTSCLGGSSVASDAPVGASAARLATLGNYGGTTPTTILEQGSSALALIPNGTSITTGPSGTVTVACPATDQRGVTSAAGQACDAGATQQTAPTSFAAGTGGVNAAAASDANDCSEAATPCASLEGALAQTAPAGTIELSGTFAQSRAANIGASVTLEPNPAFTAQPAIDGTAQDSDGLINITGVGPVVTVTDLLLENGNATSGDVGGAINNNATSGQLTVDDSTLLDNTGQNGGAIDNSDNTFGASLTVANSSLIGNSAPDGGAIDNNDNFGVNGITTITDSTFFDNTAADGGAVDNNDNMGAGASLTITQSTLAGDVGTQLGNEIGNDHYTTGGEVWAGADIFDGSCDDFSPSGAWTDAGYSVATDGTCLSSTPAGTDLVSSHAGDLGALANNGGPTQTLALETSNVAIGLIPLGTSVATGTGTFACPLGADQRGVASLSGQACDAGAVQYTGQTLSFSPTPPTSVVVGQPGVSVSAASSSGLPASYSTDSSTTNASCTLAGGSVSFAHAGSCVIDADQGGDGNFAPAATISHSFTVGSAATSTALTYAGGDLTAAVGAVAPGGGTPGGTVQFQTGGEVIGTASLSSGTAKLAYAVPVNSSAQVTASYTGTTDYTASHSSALTVAGAVATTTTTTTTTTPMPTTTTPTKHRPAPRPSISAKLSSSRARSRTGWWTSPVKVTFTCARHGARLRGHCPGPVLLKHSGKGQHLARTIRTTAGKTASVVVAGIDIDLLRPSVRIAGPNARRSYALTSPAAHCQASERISGIRSCRLASRTTEVPGGSVIRYTARATSNAGITAIVRSTVHVSDIALRGATPRGGGSYGVTPGQSYTLEVLSRTRPEYLNAAPSPLGPTGPNAYFTRAGSIGGTPLWRVTVRITAAFARFPAWNIGVRVGGATTLVRLIT
jgi:hypothetical protein